MQIWREAVEARHDFLKAADRDAIEGQLFNFRRKTPQWLAVDAQDRFMLLAGSHMEALFVDPASKGKGVGCMLTFQQLSMSRMCRLSASVAP